MVRGFESQSRLSLTEQDIQHEPTILQILKQGNSMKQV